MVLNMNELTKEQEDYLLEEARDKDYCSDCKKEIQDEDLVTINEEREFWGAPCFEEIVIGYECSKCGHKEDF